MSTNALEAPSWQCSTFLDGKNHRVCTKEKSLVKAKDFAEDWFFRLRQMKPEGTLSTGPSFAQAAKRFIDELYSKIAISACLRGCHDCRQISSALMVLKNVSTTALSQQLPFPLVDTWKPCWRRSFWSS